MAQHLVFTIGGNKLDSFSDEDKALEFAKIYCKAGVERWVQVCRVVANVKGEANVTVEVFK